MAFWSFIECRWCGFTGCAAPIGDECPRCGRLPDPVPDPKPEIVEDQSPRA